ncbi:hypothetical protein [Sinorhizobium meliloti]|uniref:hypothetical protein n=1 Tax=Rhizobium meliloti TaxID=382 RepID=UPI000FDB7EF2|nr:hypothetical protein [Sinorhizobium meliloti]MCO6425689.1 hypothetical protein [Sinorhizobium meliloti]RVL38717.1 hypothetical protein CN148_09370 [Sinorhizobium meliloti]
MADVIQLYSATGMHYAVDLAARRSTGSTVEAVIITARSNANTVLGQGEFKVDFDLPDELTSGGRLKTWSEIQAEIKAFRDAARADLAAARERMRDNLREQLADRSISLNANTGAFVGIDGVGFAGASATAQLSIDLLLLDPTLQPKPADDAAVLTARLSASGTVQLGGNTCTAAMLLVLVVTRGALVSAVPSLSLEGLPAAKIPTFDFRWPSIDWPSLNWSMLDVNYVATLLRFDLPIPKAGDFDQPLHINWTTPQPRIAFAIDASKHLTITTTQNGTGELVCDTIDANGNPFAQKIADITGFGIALSSGGSFSLTGAIKAANVSIDLPRNRIEQPDALPFTIELDPGKLEIQITADINLPQSASADVTATLDLPRVLIRAKSDPALLLALGATYEQLYDSATGASSGKLTRLEIVEPYPLALTALAARDAADAAAGLIRLIGAIRLPKPDVPETGLAALLERIGAMIGAAVKWMARQAGSALDALLGVAEAIGNALEEVVRWLRNALGKLSTSDPHVAIEVRLDARSFALRQIVISPAWSVAPNELFSSEAAALDVSVPLNWRPSLVIDLDGPPSVALIALQGKDNNTSFTLGTDLWLARDAGIESVADTDVQGKRPTKRLIQVAAKLSKAQPVVIFRFRSGKAAFFETMEATVTPLVESGISIAGIAGPVVYRPINWSDLAVDVEIEPGTAERLLPFLQSSKGNAEPSFLENLDQYMSVKPGTPKRAENGVVELPLNAELRIRKTKKVQLPLTLGLNLKTFELRFSGPEMIEIKGTSADRDFDVLGLSGEIVPKTYKSGDSLPDEYGFYKLDFSKGDVRLGLADGARLDLSYGRVASGGRGIVFRVDELSLSRGGLDLTAKVDPDTPVQLAGVDMPFRFDGGGLSIKRSEIQAFSIKGAGQLPPELVGEANATISISMGRGKDGSLIVQAAEATLDKSNDPLVCHGTRFKLTLSAIGLEFKDFSSEGAGYHFYFTLTGSAEFKPRAGEFTEGLLKNFGSLTITLDKAPLARDPSMLLRAIEFQVAVEPKKRINFFNLFTFELRGIGFHPASQAFGGKPAMSVSGQVNFVEAGDLVSPKFDFHKLWIAPPKDGETLPQVRFDGLTVGVRFGGAASIEGTAIAVDDQLPSLYKPGALPADVTAHGFLASGKLTIKGWGQMAASMGFLELQKRGGELRQAFFLYGEAGELSIEIPTPLGPIYLREVGFGFGYRFTLAAFNRADQVRNVRELIQVLDDISKYQGELATVRAWEPEAAGNRLTLALRGLISISSASGEREYNADAEKEIPNPVLFDIVAALRSDLTFFMNARVWIARNYADWHDSSATDAWRTNPTLRGYVYLSVPRKEFLARMIADGTGDVDGKHPELPAQLVAAMKAVRWSATTYIRPGLFHQEFGWPYELGFTFERDKTFQIDCQGGLVNRIEDLSILYGIAFRARGFAQIGGSVGGRSFGASVLARADFSIDAKFIAYLSIQRFNETLFYGSLAFDVSISLQVRVWLEFSIGIKDIHLEIGFSLSLTLSIALEVAVSPRAIGGRAAASVGVGAFGRSVRLGIGFGFNEGALNTARSRVERFLALGLTVATPDAEQGVAPPAPEQPRGPATRDADQVLDHSLDKHEEISAGPLPQPTPEGRDLQPSGYWAMLFPVAGQARDGERFVMIFVPRDHSETGLPEAALPKTTAGGLLGTFYAPPSVYEPSGPVPPSLVIRNGSMTRPVAVKKLEPRKDNSGNTTREVLFGDSAAIEISYDVARTAFQSGQDTLSLGRFLGQCFVRVGASATDLREPHPRRIDVDPERLPDAREAAAQILATAGRDQIALKAEERAANEIEERRSAVIASLCESAGKLAMGGEAAWTIEATEVGLDVRSLGVAFVVTRANIDELFEPAGANGEDAPRRAKFELDAAVGGIGTLMHSVHLFNPPERMFRERGPKLAEPIVEATRTGIRLDWDLEPAFGLSTGVWNDPEFDLQHYRIERTLMRGGAVMASVPPRRVTVKAAAPMRLVRDLNTGEFVWRFLRPNAQYVDDLADLPGELRAAILPGAEKSEKAAAQVPDTLRYIVVPVDTAGTAGAPTPLQLDIKAPSRSRDGIRRAVLHFEYRNDNAQIRNIDAPPTRPIVTLGLDDGMDPPPAKGERLDERGNVTDKRTYILRVRRERAAPTGLYGNDAVTDALARPTAGDFAQKHVTDEDFELTLPKVKSNNTPNQIPWFDDPRPLAHSDGYGLKQVDSSGGNDLEKFFRTIGVNLSGEERARDGARGVRFAIRPKHELGESPGPWCPVDITMLIDSRESNAPSPKLPPIAAPVEIFEHPVAIDAAPLLFDDLGGESGRVLVWHPAENGLLSSLLTPAANDPALVLLRDGERRVATRVRWNGRPAADDVDAANSSAKRLARLFGGFDLFEIDAADEVESAATAPAAVAIAYKFSTAVEDADPGNGTIRLNRKPQSQATAVFADLRDRSGADRTSLLDLINDSSERVKGQVRLVKANEASRWLAFDLTAAITAHGYRKLVLTCTDASGPTPFADNDAVVLLFTRMPARHVARVQALPAALARLDPPEIADFAKVEAHYPSETRRLQKNGAGRRAAWYSPAESYVVWPQHTLRRALSIKVDETILTELLSNGRPHSFERSLKVGDRSYGVLRRSGGPFDNSQGPWTARGLRMLLQDLTWDPDSADAKKHYDEHREQFRNARVTITAREAGGAVLASAEWSIDLDPLLHPVLTDTIDWARYDEMPPTAFPPLNLDQATFDAQLTAQTLDQSVAVEFRLDKWPTALAPNVLGFRSGGATSFPDKLRFEYPPAAKTAQEKKDSLLAALARLVTNLPALARKKLAEDFAKDQGSYNNVRLLLQCEMLPSVGAPGVEISFPVNVRSMFEDLERSTYRRYEPVLEPSPKVGATDVANWFDETPAERDPCGWGILRTLGLGAGLRLYDTETREYLAPDAALRQLQKAMNKALAWYDTLSIGAPFVDVVTRAGGTMRLASFDGGTPATTPDDVQRLINHDALALTQISLRPLPDRWRRHAGDQTAIEKPVAYLAIRKATGQASPLTIDMNKINAAAIAVADVLDLTAQLAKPPSVTLSNYVPDGDPKRKRLNDELTGGAGQQSTLMIDIARAKDGEVVALVRATVSDGDAFGIFGQAWGGGGDVSEIADPMGTTGLEPFGRFGDMAAERYVALAGSHPRIIEANEALQRYAERRWPKAWPASEDEAKLLARIPDWTRRFVDHAPASKPPRDVHFSLAEVTRPDPWRVGVQDDGTMDVLLTHDDRKRRLKRYAIRPFGRYEGFVDALRAADNEANPRVPQLFGAWSDWLAAEVDAASRFEESWSRRLLDIVIPRTEPVAPPVLVDAKRIEILPPGETNPKRARRVLEFIYKRHTEELLSEANVTVEGALSFETTAVGFWREFPMQRWAQDLVPNINTAAAFGELRPGPNPAALIASDDKFGGLAAREGGRYTDGWRGTLAIRTEALPFFFRIHAAAYAAAGVVVSDPVIATVEEGHYDLHLPWKQDVFGEKTPVPRWSVLRRDGAKPGVYLEFHLPLVRLLDGMPVETRPIWLSHSAVPEVFSLPDPFARYEIRALTVDSAGLSAASAELDVIGEQRSEDSSKTSGHRVNVIGPLFAADSAEPDELHRCTNHGVWWQLAISAKLQQKEQLETETFAPRIDPVVIGSTMHHPLELIELDPQAFAAGAEWQNLAPQTRVTATVTPVANTDAAAFAQFKVDVTFWRDAFAAYAENTAGKAILDFLQAWVDTDGNAPPPTTLTVNDFMWGLPRLPEGRPTAVHFTHTAIGDWRAPADAGIARREALRQLKTSKTEGGYDQDDFDTGVRELVRTEMRRLSAARKEREPGNRFLDFPPFASPLSDSLATTALKVGLATAPDGSRLLPPSADVIARVTINANALKDAAKVVALMRALEASPFTALAIAELGVLEDGVLKDVDMSVLVHLPCNALLESGVANALADLGAADQADWRAVSLLLRMPPTDQERDTIMAAITTTVTDAAERDALAAFADRTMSGQVFGIGRTLGVKVFRGSADPAEDAIVRSGGGAQPCQ